MKCTVGTRFVAKFEFRSVYVLFAMHGSQTFFIVKPTIVQTESMVVAWDDMAERICLSIQLQNAEIEFSIDLFAT